MPENDYPMVSVIMNAFNSEKYLREAIDSVYAQTYSNWEIVLWDDASTDRTGEIARSYDGHLRYFRGVTTVPLGEARNLAIEQCRGKFIAFLDCDDIWLPSKLAQQIPLFKSHLEVGVIYGDVATIDAYGNVIMEHRGKYKSENRNIFANLLLEDNFINWQTVVIRRNVLEQVGKFRSYNQVEDYDLLLRCAVDYAFMRVESVVAYYRLHEMNLHHDILGDLLEHNDLIDYWRNNLPPRFGHIRPALEHRFAERCYLKGRQFCLEGNVSDGDICLWLSWPTYRWRALLLILLANLLGGRWFPRVYSKILRLKQYLAWLSPAMIRVKSKKFL